MCREHVVDVRNDYEKFLTTGGDVAVITMGTVEQTVAFRNRNELPMVCLADPERLAYRAYGVRRAGILGVAGPAVWAGGLKATLRAGIGKPIGDVMQMHGSFIVDPASIIRYAHRPKNSADQPTNDELIAELGKLVGTEADR